MDDRVAEQSWSLKERETTANEQARQLVAEQHEALYPSKRFLHKLVLLLRLCTGVSAINMAVGQVLGMVFQSTGPIQYVLRIYVVLLCLLVILNELEYFSLTIESRILHLWITRGILYAFIGLLGLEENDTSSSTNTSSAEFHAGATYIKAVAWIMIGIGALYTLMGLCCLQIIYGRVQLDYEQRVERAKILREGLPQHVSSTVPSMSTTTTTNSPANDTTIIEPTSA